MANTTAKGSTWLRVAILVGAVPPILIFGRYLHGASAVAEFLAIFSVPFLLAYLWNRKIEAGLRELDSLAELADSLSESKGARRSHLLWYEYVIARDVVRGTYDGQRPWVYKHSAEAAEEHFGEATRAGFRQMIGSCGGLWVFFGWLSLHATDWDLTEAPAAFAFLSAMLVITVAAMTLWLWLRARTAAGRLGRRVEAASYLENDARWEALLEAAQDELALQSRHS